MDIEITDLKRGTSLAREVLYFTGGLVGLPLEGGGLALIPLRGDGEILGVPDLSWPQINQIAAHCGCRFVGSNEIVKGAGAAPTEFWRPSFAPTEGGLYGAESWGAISFQAHLSNDSEYADAARYISVSIQSAGIRLRDIAKAHHNQLRWALVDGRKPGNGFSNVALFDLYVDFHSLATELCSARDHLARTAAITLGAKVGIDSMARLEDWLKKSANAEAARNPLVTLLLTAWGSKENPGWLRKLGDIRNEMVHKQPMAANPEATMLRLAEVESAIGPVFTIRLAPSKTSGLDFNALPDPFLVLLDLYNCLQQLAMAAGSVARYQPTLPSFREQ